jgi:hypothetical protein
MRLARLIKFDFDYLPQARIFSFPAHVRDTSDAIGGNYRLLLDQPRIRAYCSDKRLKLGCLSRFTEFYPVILRMDEAEAIKWNGAYTRDEIRQRVNQSAN